MSLFKTLLVGASLVVATIAQQPLQFATVPNITAGEKNVDIAWIGGDGTSPITITLRNGPAGNLNNVSTLADGVTGLGHDYYWNVPSSLPAGEYALFIAQGDEYNYSPRFQVTGTSSSSSSVSSTDSASSTAAPSSTISGVSGIGLLPPVSVSSISSIIASLNGTLSSLASNLTSSMPITAAPGASGAGASGAAGTGIPMVRNTTLSSATLTAASSTDTATSTATDTSGASSSSAGPSSGTIGSSTASSTSSGSSATTSSVAATRLGSPLAFVLSAFAAIVYLN